jgi:YVTN family beta-propeller protein
VEDLTILIFDKKEYHMKIKNHYRSIVLFCTGLFLLAFVSCENEPLIVNGDGLGFRRGVYIVNEGNFLAGNASISFYEPQSDTVHNQIFYRVNQSPVGDVANSMTIWNGKAYLTVNNSGKIYIADPLSMEYLGKITGLASPRNLEVVNEDKAYVSDLFSSRLNIVNPTSFELLDSSEVSGHINLNGYTAEHIIISGSYAYVACWSYGDRIFVINTDTDSLIDSIQVGKQPNSMVMDKNGDIWVLCDGGYTGSPYGQENASLWKLDTDNRSARLKLEFEDIMDSPVDLIINATGDTLLYLNGDINITSIDNVREEVFIPGGGRFLYGIGADPYDNTLYVADAVDFQQNGMVYRYSMQGDLLDSFQVGINPGSFCFLNEE